MPLLLLDSDVFCRLAACSLLEDFARALGRSVAEYRRLPALPHMLRRGKLRRQLGDTLADQLIAAADRVAAVPAPPARWLDHLTGVPQIDPGEAQLIALACEGDTLLLTADRRCLCAIKQVPAIVPVLAGKVLAWESVLVLLAYKLGPESLRARLAPILYWDKVAQVCFSQLNLDPMQGLESYLRALRSDIGLLQLWEMPPEPPSV